MDIVEIKQRVEQIKKFRSTVEDLNDVKIQLAIKICVNAMDLMDEETATLSQLLQLTSLVNNIHKLIPEANKANGIREDGVIDVPLIGFDDLYEDDKGE